VNTIEPAAALDAAPFMLEVSDWVNSAPIALESLRGRVVVIEAFQMLCPGCISHGLPLAQRIRRGFDPDEVVVLGLHTVFEHHSVMGREALEVFLAEYRIAFPVAIDRPVSGRAIPATMGRYALPGTPTTVILDRSGRLRKVFFGHADELIVGAAIGALLGEHAPVVVTSSAGLTPASCSLDGSCD
jgi:hypothetical protein